MTFGGTEGRAAWGGTCVGSHRQRLNGHRQALCLLVLCDPGQMTSPVLCFTDQAPRLQSGPGQPTPHVQNFPKRPSDPRESCAIAPPLGVPSAEDPSTQH